ncbi:MAG: endonuclease [Solirubrobacteraceae bacterium]|nr:endonuclease [Solirubrobacteraceae bacterium]
MLSQGDQGEIAAIAWLAANTRMVALPLGNASDYDVLAEIDGSIARVQVKTTSQQRGRRWPVSLATRGGNQSWNRIVKRFSAGRCDYLYAHTACGRRWFIPAKEVEGATCIVLGGPKYAAFEIEPGAPLTLS